MSAEIVVEGDDYRFTTDEWATFTGRQIIAYAFFGFGVGLFLVGFVAGMNGMPTFEETARGITIVHGTGSAWMLLGPFVGAFGLTVASLGYAFRPRPQWYGEPIEEADPR